MINKVDLYTLFDMFGLCVKKALEIVYNFKSNQKLIGTIRGSNLCTEIIEFTSPDEVAVCNLAFIALTEFASEDRKSYDFKSLANP